MQLISKQMIANNEFFNKMFLTTLFVGKIKYNTLCIRKDVRSSAACVVNNLF